MSADLLAGSCEAELAAVEAAITASTIEGKGGEQSEINLLAKVNEARLKLAEGKPADALQKLENVRTSVIALSTPDAKGKTKLNSEAAGSIIAALDLAVECIEPLAPAA